MQYKKRAEVTPELERILEKNHLPTTDWGQSIVGFSNTVWIHDAAVVKVYQGNELERITEQWFYRENGFSFAPECLGMGENYLILENVQGKGLFHYWPKWSLETREEAFTQGCRMIRQIHGINKESFPIHPKEDRIGVIGREGRVDPSLQWKQEIFSRIALQLEILKNRDPENLTCYEAIESCVRAHKDALDGSHFVVTYPDFHLDNLIWSEKKEKLYLLDYEDLCAAPADYFLDTPLRMIAYPFLYANEIDDPLQKKEHYEGLLDILQKELPECFAHPRWRERVALYAIAYDLKHLAGNIGLKLLQERVSGNVKVLTGEELLWR